MNNTVQRTQPVLCERGTEHPPEWRWSKVRGWFCRLCVAATVKAKREMAADNTMSILMLQERIEREPRADLRAALRVEMGRLVATQGGA